MSLIRAKGENARFLRRRHRLYLQDAYGGGRGEAKKTFVQKIEIEKSKKSVETADV